MNIRSTITALPKYLAAFIGIACLFGFTGHAFGAFNAYLKIDGTTSESITTGSFAGDFPVTAFAVTGAGAGGGSTGEKSITITKSVDQASPGFYSVALAGSPTTYPTVTLYYVDKGKVILTYTFTTCTITSVVDGVDAVADERPSESITFTYGAVNLTVP
ncbi:MAG: type VI secretion system tube protein Hcp [Chthoniobacteraceae bacterium]|jgi:type VI protein secretion system component Hcp